MKEKKGKRGSNSTQSNSQDTEKHIDSEELFLLNLIKDASKNLNIVMNNFTKLLLKVKKKPC